MLTLLFRRSFVGLDFTVEDIRAMPPRLPSILEFVILKASDVPALQEPDGKPDDDDLEFEDSMFAAHNAARQKADSLEESDLIHSLHEQGYTYDSIYNLLLAEIQMLQEGSERAEDRREAEQKQRAKEREKEQKQAEKRPAQQAENQPAPSDGNRTDMAGQLFGRR